MLGADRVAVAGYSNKIYKVTTDDVENATKFKEAPAVDLEKILSDKQTLRDRENQMKNITIPVEVKRIQFRLIGGGPNTGRTNDFACSVFVCFTLTERLDRHFGSPRGTHQDTTCSHLPSIKKCHAKWNKQFGLLEN